MESKSIFASKTFWGAILTPLLTYAGTRYGLALDAEAQAAIVGAASAVAGVVLRVNTSQPVHIVPKEPTP